MSSPTPFAGLPWQSRFVDRLPGDAISEVYSRRVKDVFYSRTEPTPVRSPRLLGWSDVFAEKLGIARPPALVGDASLAALAGNQISPGMKPYAARYGGHQFGQWAGQLGDGRAITLGEVDFPDQGRLEFQLKGAGPTPYSRRADGRAVLRSSIREFLCSEAMHHLGIPTTRALSLVATGDEVVRDMFYDGNPRAEPGAIVCRVSPSFLRFGNFEILAAEGEPENLRRLALLFIQDHHPELDPEDADVFGKLLDQVALRTAEMVTHWMRVGFVHGVMNSDNMSMLGLTLDYGPYGWLEPYDPSWTPNTTDAQGRRYCFGNQPQIAQWNLARLCEAFRSIIPEIQRLQSSLSIFQDAFQSGYSQMLGQKIGLPNLGTPEDQTLIEGLFDLFGSSQADFTIFFRSLCDWRVKDASEPDERFLALLEPSLYTPLTQDLKLKWIQWSRNYTRRLRDDSALLPDEERSKRMKKVNPRFVLRNYLVQNAISAAENGDLAILDRLFSVLKTPYDDLPANSELIQKRPAWAANSPGCSALSCSS